MTTPDLEALGETRRLIFHNYASGVPIEDIMSAFKRSKDEVLAEVAFVGKKIREYRHRRMEPPLECSNEKDIRWNRKALLETLRKLGPQYLSTELLIPKIVIQKPDSLGALIECSRRAGANTRTR